MFESLVTMCCLFLVIAYLTTKRLGLLDPVPRDPKARVAGYASATMSLLKEQLIGSEVREWTPQRISFVKGAREGTIWETAGQVYLQQGDTQSVLPLGDHGTLTFELQETNLSATILAAEEETGAEHSVTVSLQVAAPSDNV